MFKASVNKHGFKQSSIDMDKRCWQQLIGSVYWEIGCLSFKLTAWLSHYELVVVLLLVKWTRTVYLVYFGHFWTIINIYTHIDSAG